MKYPILILTTLFVFLGTIAQAQTDAISTYFNQYVEDDRFTVVYISPKMFSLFKKMDLNLEDDEAEALMEIASDLKGLRVLVAEENTQNFYQEATAKINTTSYEVLMTVRNKGEENVDFLIKEDSNENISELLLLVGGPEEFVLMSLVGTIDIEKVSQLAEAFKDDDPQPQKSSKE
jgi:hypothetical protein